MVHFSSVFVLCWFLPTLIIAQCEPAQFYDNIEQRCLQFFAAPLSFQNAETICETLSGHLVSVHNIISNNFLVTQVQKHFVDSIWLGAKETGNDVTNSLNWYWADGSPFDYQHYKVGQPTSQGATTSMQLQISTTKWFTAPCDSISPFVCQFVPPATPTCAPPTIAPCPKAPSHCPSEYAWFQETDSCYKSFNHPFTNYTFARSVCIAEGGDLTSIHSQSENHFISELSKSGVNISDPNWNNNVWIGLIYVNNVWQWTDGTAVNYLNWGVGEPNLMDREWWTSLVADRRSGGKPDFEQWNNVETKRLQRAFVCKHAPLH